MTNHFTQAQAATVQDGGQTFCTPPANDVKPVRVPPAGSSLGECSHFDALGNALQVGDTVQFSDWMPVEVITALLPGGRFAHGDKTNFCCVVVLVALAPAKHVPSTRYVFSHPEGEFMRHCLALPLQHLSCWNDLVAASLSWGYRS